MDEFSFPDDWQAPMYMGIVVPKLCEFLEKVLNGSLMVLRPNNS